MFAQWQSGRTRWLTPPFFYWLTVPGLVFSITLAGFGIVVLFRAARRRQRVAALPKGLFRYGLFGKPRLTRWSLIREAQVAADTGFVRVRLDNGRIIRFRYEFKDMDDARDFADRVRQRIRNRNESQEM